MPEQPDYTQARDELESFARNWAEQYNAELTITWKARGPSGEFSTKAWATEAAFEHMQEIARQARLTYGRQPGATESPGG